MSNLRGLRILGAAAATAAVLAACGGSSKPAGPSGLDPANMAPASSVAFGEVAIRPQGTLGQDLRTLVSKLAGPHAVQSVTNSFTKSFAGKNGSWSTVRPWLGQRIGLAVTGFPTSQFTASQLDQHLVVIAPTGDPAAARNYIAKHPETQPGVVNRVVGDYVLAGWRAAVSAAAATKPSDSVASSATYKKAVATVGAGQLAVAFVRIGAVLQAVRPTLLKAMHATGALESQALSQLKHISADATLTLGVTVSAHTFALDIDSAGFSSGAAKSTTPAAADVSALPSGSWLALALGSHLNAKQVSQLRSRVSELPSFPNEPGAERSVFNIIENEVLPALGPLSVSASGTSLLTLRVGAALTPSTPSTGAPLLSMLKGLVKQEHLPIAAGLVGSKLVATYGYNAASEFLNPSSTLASNPTYKQALAQLPAGSRVPLFVNFGPIALLRTLDTRASDKKVWQVVAKLNYLIAGGTKGQVRIVLGIH